MTLVSVIPGAMHAAPHLAGPWAVGGMTLDASGEKAASIFRVPKTGNIRTLRFRLGTVTTGQTLKAGLYTVDTSGDPTTTAYGGMAVGTVAVADGDDNTEKVVTLLI